MSDSNLPDVERAPESPAPASEPIAAVDVPAVVERARTAQRAWAGEALEARIAAVEAARRRLLARSDEAAALVARETGKPEVEALLGEVLASSDVFTHWCGVLDEELEPREVALDALSYPGKEAFIHTTPRGVVAAIMPWNFPLALPLRTIVPALLAGNAVVFKPSEVTPGTGALLGELFAGLVPDGVLTVVQGGGEVGAALAEADVDMVVFTGSPRAGRAVARACAERLTPCELELGGKDAAIVLADCDVARTARGIVWAAMLNAGQNCGAVERVYVERPVADALRTALVTEVKALRERTDIGPLTTDGQAAIVERHVREAKEAGATILVGGERGEGRYFAPTLLEVDREDLAVIREESFGPVLPLRVVESADEAISLANASRYGLTASVWSRDVRRAEKLARELRVGVVTVNAHSFTGAIPGAPWGGRGESGWGVTGSPFALHAVTRPKLVLVDRSRGARELYWFPYTPTLTAIARALIALKGGARTLGGKLAAIVTLLSSLPKRLRE